MSGCLLMPSAMQEVGIIAASQTEFPRPAKWTFYLFMFSLADRSCFTLCSSPGLEPVEKALLRQILAVGSRALLACSYYLCSCIFFPQETDPDSSDWVSWALGGGSLFERPTLDFFIFVSCFEESFCNLWNSWFISCSECSGWCFLSPSPLWHLLPFLFPEHWKNLIFLLFLKVNWLVDTNPVSVWSTTDSCTCIGVFQLCIFHVKCSSWSYLE